MMLKSILSLTALAIGASAICENTCMWAGDGECDDVGDQFPPYCECATPRPQIVRDEGSATRLRAMGSSGRMLRTRAAGTASPQAEATAMIAASARPSFA